MPLRPPNLDDRKFDDLVLAAIERIRETCPEWTDLTPGDPGMTLLELFAYLTETMIFRLNRVPEKAYVQFLNVLGVKLQPPAAAVTSLVFRLKEPRDTDIEIPAGTRVAAGHTGGDQEPPVFSTSESAVIAAGDTSAEVRAFHGERVEAELLGTGSGLPGQTFAISRPPVIAPMGDHLDFVLGVETEALEEKKSGTGDAWLSFEDKTFRIWREVEGFVNLEDPRNVYVVDRIPGVINFAQALRMTGNDGEIEEQPGALAEVPGRAREVRAWYRTGGGDNGNVAPNTLTNIKDPIPGVTLDVTNPARATGGRDAETLDNALQRGPQELHSLRRAVTPQDFELIALRSSGGVNRAHAYTKFRLWKYAQRGTVEVILVPHVSEEQIAGGPVTVQMLKESENEEILKQIRDALEQRKPLGTTCSVMWSHCKAVKVKARVTIHREEDRAAVEQRVRQRLYNTINPLRDATSSGWEFGKPLTAYQVYQVLGAEPGVKDVAAVLLCDEDVPDAQVSSLGVDSYQPNTWYAGARDAVYRTVNDGDGWERVAKLEGENVRLIKPFPREASGAVGRAGLVAVVTELPNADDGSRVYLSRNCGESWERIFRPQFSIEDIAWVERDGVPTLLLATEKGLYELAGRSGTAPVPILVDPDQTDLGFYAIAVSTDVRGAASVAVSARARGGVFLSVDGGKPKSFKNIGLKDELVRVLSVEHRGPNRYLWAGLAATGEDPGKGCLRWQLTASGESPEGWRPFDEGWKAGGCRSLAFLGTVAYAASRRLGVLSLDVDAKKPRWTEPDANCGLPIEKLSEFESVDFVAAEPLLEGAEGAPRRIMAAGPKGVYRSKNKGAHYENCSRTEHDDLVTVPSTWVLCSATHEVHVAYEHEEHRD